MELGPLSDIASEPGVTDIAVTCDGTVWVAAKECGRTQCVRHSPTRKPYAISPYDCARSSAEDSTTHVR